MKRKVLSDVDCMSGTGWYSESDDWYECPSCWNKLQDLKNKRKIKCSICGNKFEIERGIQLLYRLNMVNSASQPDQYCT